MKGFKMFNDSYTVIQVNLDTAKIRRCSKCVYTNKRYLNVTTRELLGIDAGAVKLDVIVRNLVVNFCAEHAMNPFTTRKVTIDRNCIQIIGEGKGLEMSELCRSRNIELFGNEEIAYKVPTYRSARI